MDQEKESSNSNIFGSDDESASEDVGFTDDEVRLSPTTATALTHGRGLAPRDAGRGQEEGPIRKETGKATPEKAVAPLDIPGSSTKAEPPELPEADGVRRPAPGPSCVVRTALVTARIPWGHRTQRAHDNVRIAPNVPVVRIALTVPAAAAA
jgi:hypothetical protein